MAAFSLRTGYHLSGSQDAVVKAKKKSIIGVYPSTVSLRFPDSKSKYLPFLRKKFMGKSIILSNQKGSKDWCAKALKPLSPHAQGSILISKAQRWWEKSLQPNMVEIHSPQQFVDSLLNGGDKLVIVDFYSPGCGGCKALHPKICQLAEMNPDTIFLKVNHEEHKTMCHALHVHVLPFFRFYRGAEGKVCSFSCTNATIKKFKDALTKHGADRCSLGPAKGLDESDLVKLSSNGLISIDLPVQPAKEELTKTLVMNNNEMSDVWSKTTTNMGVGDEHLLKV